MQKNCMALAVVLNLWPVFMVSQLPKLSKDYHKLCERERLVVNLSVTKL